MTETDILFQLSSNGDRLIIKRNLSGQLVLSVGRHCGRHCGRRASITFPGTVQLHELSGWLERHLAGYEAKEVEP